MGSTFVRILPLMAGAAVSPVILLLQVATLASRPSPVRRALLVLSASALVLAVVMAVLALTDERGGTTSSGEVVIGAWIKVVLAVLLLLGAIRALLQPAATAAETKGPADEVTAGGVHGLRYFLLGVAAMATNFTSFALVMPATHDVNVANLPGTDRVVLYLAIGLVTLAPAWLPLVGLAALGRRGPVILDQLGDWLRVHHRTIVVAVSLGFAVFLGISGLRVL
jgi:hypothetical protein